MGKALLINILWDLSEAMLLLGVHLIHKPRAFHKYNALVKRAQTRIEQLALMTTTPILDLLDED